MRSDAAIVRSRKPNVRIPRSPAVKINLTAEDTEGTEVPRRIRARFEWDVSVYILETFLLECSGELVSPVRVAPPRPPPPCRD